MQSREYLGVRADELLHVLKVLLQSKNPDEKTEAERLAKLIIVGEDKGTNVEFWNKAVLEHDGKTYYRTGKLGNRIKDGMAGIEFRDSQDARIWLYRDLTVSPD